MWDATNKRTGERIYAGDAWTPGLYDDPHKEPWISPKDNIINWDELKIDEIPLELVKGHLRKNYLVRSFFRIKDGFNAISAPESEEHKRKKTILSLLLTHDAPIFLVYDTEVYPLSDIPIDRKKIRNEKLIEVRKEILGDSYKITDICIPFHYSNYWGNGLAIEIKESEKDEHKSEKEEFWFARGYSLLWVEKEDFIEDGYGLKNEYLSVIPNSIGLFLLRKELDYKLEIVKKRIEELKIISSKFDNIDKRIDINFDRINDFLIAKKNYLIKIIDDAVQKIDEQKKEDGPKEPVGLDSWM